jgi:hypothetical protein
MRQACLIVCLAVVASGSALQAQTSSATPPPPQSARQALIEMFFGKGNDDFVKHLPDDARRTLIRKGETPETSVLLRIAALGQQFTAQGQHVETFDNGPTLLQSGFAGNGEKLEVNVEHDSLIGEDDEIELSFNYYKNDQLQHLPVVPSLTFTFRQEKEIWRLIEVTAAAHVPLTDPDYLRALRKQQDEANESQATTRLVVIANAETNYLSKHPDLGYSCSLSTLFAQATSGEDSTTTSGEDSDATPGENGALYDPGQGNEEWNGYRFSLTGCDGSPAAKYRITAVPTDSDAGMKTFCADESGTTKFVLDEKPAACFSRGKPLLISGSFSVD